MNRIETLIEVGALGDALYTWRNRMHERGMVNAVERAQSAGRHSRVEIECLRTLSPTVIVSRTEVIK